VKQEDVTNLSPGNRSASRDLVPGSAEQEVQMPQTGQRLSDLTGSHNLDLLSFKAGELRTVQRGLFHCCSVAYFHSFVWPGPRGR
jgi:hypothetical protein